MTLAWSRISIPHTSKFQYYANNVVHQMKLGCDIWLSCHRSYVFTRYHVEYLLLENLCSVKLQVNVFSCLGIKEEMLPHKKQETSCSSSFRKINAGFIKTRLEQFYSIVGMHGGHHHTKEMLCTSLLVKLVTLKKPL
jgi:hypothetical protein